MDIEVASMLTVHRKTDSYLTVTCRKEQGKRFQLIRDYIHAVTKTEMRGFCCPAAEKSGAGVLFDVGEIISVDNHVTDSQWRSRGSSRKDPSEIAVNHFSPIPSQLHRGY